MGIRDQILNADDRPAEMVDVPEWGVKVEVKGMTAGENVRFLKAVSKNGEVDTGRFQIQLLLATVYDPETGEKVFDPADADALNQKSAAAVTRLLGVASRLSGLGGDQRLEEVVTDLDGTTGNDSQ